MKKAKSIKNVKGKRLMSNEEKERWVSLLQEACTKGSAEHNMNLTSYMQFLTEQVQSLLQRENETVNK